MADYKYITDKGLIQPDTSELIKNVNAWWSEITGSTQTVDSSSIEGRIIDAETKARLMTLTACSSIVNVINPDFSYGMYLDALGGFIGVNRKPSFNSMIQCVMKGKIGTVVPKGCQITDENHKHIWVLTAETKINHDGATATFVCNDKGAIYAGIGDINTIVTVIDGWETVSSVAVATLGQDSEDDVHFRYSLRLGLGSNSINNSFSVVSSINAVKGVQKVTFYENYTSNAVDYHGVTVNPHSLYVCVDGGADNEIAEAYQVKSGGCGYSASASATPVNWTDPVSGQLIPVLFDRPKTKAIKVKLTIKAVDSLGITDVLKQSIIEYSLQNDTGNGFSLGNDTSAFEISAHVNKTHPSVFVTKCEITTVADDNFSCNPITNLIYEKSTITSDNITVELVS